MPDVDIEAIGERAPSGVVWQGDSLKEFAPYFSQREASMLKRLLLFPLAVGESVHALLVIAESPYLEDHEEYLRIILAAVGEPAALRLEAQRLNYAETMRRAVVFRADELAILAERIQLRAPSHVTLVSLQLADVVSQVVGANEYLEPFYVWQDVLRLLASLFASTGSVCDIDGHRVLVFVHGPTDEDLELTVHQVSATIARFLPEVSDIPVLRFAAKRFPDEGDDLTELARGMT